jgi:hypothetical protein
LSTTNTIKSFLIIKDGIISDCWIADSKEEAESDNPGSFVVEMNEPNKFWKIGSKYEGENHA